MVSHHITETAVPKVSKNLRLRRCLAVDFARFSAKQKEVWEEDEKYKQFPSVAARTWLLINIKAGGKKNLAGRGNKKPNETNIKLD